MDINELLKQAVEVGASDLHITVGIPPVLRIHGKLIALGEDPLLPKDTLRLAKQLINEEQLEKVDQQGQLDFSYSQYGFGRFRVNCFKQRGSYSLAIRVVFSELPSIENLGLPSILKDLTRRQRGLILVTGPTGSGKSTTLSAMIDLINNERKCHVVTLEDPIEYLHRHKKSIINQREVGSDTTDFASGLRAALRQDPDVILVGEMRDLETISTALTAAETGHLVLSTLHTLGAAQSIERIIDVFPPSQQEQIKVQLASVIEAIISQQLLTTVDGNGRIAAVEVMVANTAVRNLIRENKTHQINTVIQTGQKFGMQPMDYSLVEAYKQGLITRDTLLAYAMDVDAMKKYLGTWDKGAVY